MQFEVILDLTRGQKQQNILSSVSEYIFTRPFPIKAKCGVLYRREKAKCQILGKICKVEQKNAHILTPAFVGLTYIGSNWSDIVHLSQAVLRG